MQETRCFLGHAFAMPCASIHRHPLFVEKCKTTRMGDLRCAKENEKLIQFVLVFASFFKKIHLIAQSCRLFFGHQPIQRSLRWLLLTGALMSKEFPTKLSCYTNIKVSCKFRTRGAHGGSARHPGCHGDQGLPWPPALQAQPQVFLSMPLEVWWGWIREGFCLKEQGRFAEARERMTKTTKLLGEFPTPLDCYIWYFHFRSKIYLKQKKLTMVNINFKNC